LFFTGRRITGQTAFDWGLADILSSSEDIRSEAIQLAAEIAENAPLAVVSVREQVRGQLADAVKATTDIEGRAQFFLQQTTDHKEGIKAVSERRPGQFTGS
ncbi:MAG: enoyl-CoA hydratase/isomerase family protein, partial [Gammaproteobacteria bacterium]|nr:enoyl-CoA hydratase/isomerase family protein [Gammaproteobacteria bacterium]